MPAVAMPVNERSVRQIYTRKVHLSEDEPDMSFSEEFVALPPASASSKTSAAPRRMRRVVDVAVATVLLVVTAPIMAVALSISAMVFRANPLYLGPRAGCGGRLFVCPKIRSLPTHTPTALRKDRLDGVPITLWGRALRKSHVDELPQLWSVLVGSMSLVGPRPDLAEFAGYYDAGVWSQRLTVRPGITGLWQVSEAVIGSIDESPEYDQFYLAHRGWALDTWILWRTVISVIGRPGITLDDVPTWGRKPLG
jgi:sugar transferase EpsL